MATNLTDVVLVDTCVWAAFFSKSGGGLKRETTNLLKRDRVAIVGPVVADPVSS